MKNIIQAINNSPYKIYGAFAGCGQNFVYNYLNEPGASKTIMGFNFPYNQICFDHFVLHDIEGSYASLIASRKLALYSLIEGYCKEANFGLLLGIGATASLSTDNERVGRTHKIYVSICDRGGDKPQFKSVSVEEIPQDLFTRKEEDEFVTWLIFSLINNITTCFDYKFSELNKLLKVSKVTWSD